MTTIHVVKRNGQTEKLDLEKIHRVVSWACEGLDNVSPSEVEMKSHIQFCDNIKTSDIHAIMIKSAADLISVRYPNYQYVAARLAMFDLRKKAYGEFNPPAFYTHIQNMVSQLRYDDYVLKHYTKEEIDTLDSFIDHTRDFDFAYAGVGQLAGKYLVQDRTTGRVYESPQFLYMMIAACLFAKYPKDTRMDYVKRFYDAASTFKISLPTPIMAGLRTPARNFASCVLINIGDSLDSICAGTTASIKYVSQKAGIGFNAGSIRAVGSPIRDGSTVHTGLTPFYKLFQAAIKSCSQGGVRNGAATVYYPIWHYEVESLLVLKNNRGVEDNRARHMDYGVQLNGLMYKRLIQGGEITLFSPNEVPGLYDAFFADQAEFERLYTEAENNPNIRKKSVKAVELFSALMQERASTGRVYIHNVDHTNTHSGFDPKVAPVTQSNLCCFVGDTKVIVADNEKGDNVRHMEIEDVVERVNKGEVLYALSYNERPFKPYQEYKRITAGMLTKEDKVYRVTIEDAGIEDYYGDTVAVSFKCTGDHKFLTEEGWKEAKDLDENDFLIDINGCQDAKVFAVEALDEVHPLYDITVEDNHNFFIVDEAEYCTTDVEYDEENEDEGYEYDYYETTDIAVCVHNCEITLPTKPMNNLDCTDGEIALCILAGVNFGLIDKPEDLEDSCDILVRALDELIDYQEYMVPAAETSTINRRSLGVGVINYAYFLAKNKTRYSDGRSLALTHRFFEAFQYYLLKTSTQLAKEKGACGYSHETTYAQGILPIDTYKKYLDEICNEPLHMDWESLRQDMKQYGVRNSVVSALMPSECQVKENKLLLEDGTSKTLGELLIEAGIDVEGFEREGAPARITTMKPFTLASGREVSSVWYNGRHEPVINLKFQDGSQYGFTRSHKLYTDKGWQEVNELSVGSKVKTENGYLEIVHVELDSNEENLVSTWDVSTIDEQYILANGCISHNTSSQISNSTNGIEPPRGYVSVKASKDGILRQVVPEFSTLSPYYELLWEMPDNKGYLENVGIMQKFIDQAISTNTNYDPKKYPGDKVPMKVLLQDLLYAYKLGLKTLYYHNTRDGADDKQEDIVGCEGGACKL